MRVYLGGNFSVQEFFGVLLKIGEGLFFELSNLVILFDNLCKIVVSVEEFIDLVYGDVF